MAVSNRRLSLKVERKTTMNVTPLKELEARYLDYHAAANHSPRTLQRYRETFVDFHRFLEASQHPSDLSSLTTSSLRGFGLWLKETPIKPWRGRTQRSIHTVHGRLKDLRAFCRWLFDEELLEAVPKVTLPKLPDELFPILTDDELKELFRCPHLSSPGPQAVRNRALVAFLLDTGVRLSEVANLTLLELDLANGMAKITGKGNRQRMVFFHSGAEADLRKWLAIRGDEAGPVFCLSPRGIQMLFKRIQDETGLDVHAHKLRHQSATMMVRQTGDIHYAKRVLGHRQLSTVERYLSLSTADLKTKHAASSPYESIRSQLEPVEAKPARKRLSLN